MVGIKFGSLPKPRTLSLFNLSKTLLFALVFRDMYLTNYKNPVHNDLKIKNVTVLAKIHNTRFNTKLNSNTNPLIKYMARCYIYLDKPSHRLTIIGIVIYHHKSM